MDVLTDGYIMFPIRLFLLTFARWPTRLAMSIRVLFVVNGGADVGYPGPCARSCWMYGAIVSGGSSRLSTTIGRLVPGGYEWQAGRQLYLPPGVGLFL